MEENINVSQEVVEPEQPETDIGVQTEGGPEVKEEIAKPQQTPEQNAFYAKARREMEKAQKKAKELEERLSQIAKERERLLQVAKLQGYDGSTVDDIADQMEAAIKDKTVEELRLEREQERKRREELIKNDPEYLAVKQKAEALERMLHQKMLDEHLALIKKHDPELQAESIEDLGETFLNLMRLKMDKGEVKDDDVIVAYEMAKLEQNFGKKPAPQSPGAVSSTEHPEKEFYTPEEVDRFTREDYRRNPGLFEKVRKSMTKWKT